MTYLALVVFLAALFLTSVAAFCFWTREVVGFAVGVVLGVVALDAWLKLYAILLTARIF